MTVKELSKSCQGHYSNYINKNLSKLLHDDKPLEIDGYKFVCPMKYLKHKIVHPAHTYADIDRFLNLSRI